MIAVRFLLRIMDYIVVIVLIMFPNAYAMYCHDGIFIGIYLIYHALNNAGESMRSSF